MIILLSVLSYPPYHNDNEPNNGKYFTGDSLVLLMFMAQYIAHNEKEKWCEYIYNYLFNVYPYSQNGNTVLSTAAICNKS